MTCIIQDPEGRFSIWAEPADEHGLIWYEVRAGTKMAELVAAYEEQKRLVDDLYDVIATIEMALFMPGEGQPDLETAHRLIVAAGPSKGG